MLTLSVIMTQSWGRDLTCQVALGACNLANGSLPSVTSGDSGGSSLASNSAQELWLSLHWDSAFWSEKWRQLPRWGKILSRAPETDRFLVNGSYGYWSKSQNCLEEEVSPDLRVDLERHVMGIFMASLFFSVVPGLSFLIKASLGNEQ